MKRLTPWLIAIVLISIAGFGCVKTISDSKDTQITPVTFDRNAVLTEARANGLIMNEGEIEHMKDVSVLEQDTKKRIAPKFETFVKTNFQSWNSAALADVNAGSSFGLAHSLFKNGQFTLVVKMGALPPLEAGMHYEGWLVRRADGMRIISTGFVEQRADVWTNVYTSGQDLSAFDFYVLTRESDATNPTPEQHILEGIIY